MYIADHAAHVLSRQKPGPCTPGEVKHCVSLFYLFQGNVRDREKREVERQQLQDLVGKNLTYLSQLDGLDFDLYSGTVGLRKLGDNTRRT